MTLCGGGNGVFIVATDRDTRYGLGRWLSHEASGAIVRAAHRLGFGDDSCHEGQGWMAVKGGIVAGCLPDLLSEAIEEQEDEYGRAEAV